MELINLVETAVIADLNLDPAIATWEPLPHDGLEKKGGDTGEDQEQALIIVVTAEDRGDLESASGLGVKLVNVRVQLEQNVGIDPDTSLLSQIADKIDDRLPATHLADFSRDHAFSSSRLKVFGINAGEVEETLDIDLLRQRVIQREFVCAQLG